MKCPKCGRLAGTLDHIETEEKEVYRERYCHSCDYKFYTVEYEVERNSQFATLWNKYSKRKVKIRPVKDYGIR